MINFLHVWQPSFILSTPLEQQFLNGSSFLGTWLVLKHLLKTIVGVTRGWCKWTMWVVHMWQWKVSSMYTCHKNTNWRSFQHIVWSPTRACKQMSHIEKFKAFEANEISKRSDGNGDQGFLNWLYSNFEEMKKSQMKLTMKMTNPRWRR
jgi:hypothetical protein